MRNRILGVFAVMFAAALTAAPAHAQTAPLVVAQAAPSIQSAQQQLPAPNHDSDQPSDPCAVCAVIALSNTALFATLPVLLLPQAVEFLYLTANAAFAHLNSASSPFQPRAPPLS